MAAKTRRGRVVRGFGAIVATTGLLAACGGSSIGETADGTGTTAVAEQPGSTGTTAGTTTSGGPAQVPAAATGAASSTTGGATSATPTKVKRGAGATSSVKGAGKVTSAAAATTAATGLDAAIARYPILGGTEPCRPATLSVVNLGNVSTLSGVLGELHQPGRYALEAFVASQNACGGLNGHKIKLYVEDDQGDPSTAATKVQTLAEKHILAFVGNIQSLTIDGALPSLKKAGIPVVGGDITNNTWFTNPILFPQGSPPQAVSYGFALAASQYFKMPEEGHMWCLEVPRACEQIDRAWKELAPQVGADPVVSTQMSITNPSYVQQCLDFKSKGVQVVALSMDAASMARIARSCNSVSYHPKWVAHPLGLGNERQFLGLDLLAGTYVPTNVFPWMGDTNPAEKYWQQMRSKYIPGEASGGAASSAWTAAALLVAATSALSADNPTSDQILQMLYMFHGQPATTLGGLTVPLTFRQGQTPKIPYCLFGAISNDKNNGWKPAISKMTCTRILAPSDPQTQS